MTETKYYELRGGRDTRTLGYFEAHTDQGQAFRVNNQMRRFGELIELFNEMTPGLPYVWKKQGGFTIQIGALSTGRLAYERVDRAEAEAQTAAPPQP